MTDAELIARLRSNIFGTGTTMLAADRIEALIKEREKDHANINLKADFIDKTINQLAETEAKLAAAVEVIEWALISWDDHNKHGYNMQGDWVFDARATIAEISSEAALNKGESHE